MHRSLRLNKPCSTSIASRFGTFCGTIALLCSSAAWTTSAQEVPATVHFDAPTHVFRIDAAQSTYVLGINENGQLQTLYWGERLSESDHFAEAKASPGPSSFDLSTGGAPKEFVGWGGGLFVDH